MLGACTALLAAAFGFGVGSYPLLDPDEGRNAEVAREMAASNDYVLPRLNGVPYVDKPVLYFAAGALTMELLGPTPGAARLPSLLFTIATIALVAWFAHRTLGRDAAWVAALATAATPFTLAYARTVIFDSALTFFAVAAIVAFYVAAQAATARHPDEIVSPPGSRTADSGWRGGGGEDSAAAWCAAAWAAMGLGVLTKGPIALALPLLVALPYVAWRRAWRALADPVAVLLFAAIVLPWLFAVSREVPGFLQYALVTETAARLTTDALGRSGPLWYFLVILPAAALPWSAVALGAAHTLGRSVGATGRRLTTPRDPLVVYLALWIVMPLVFFTLSQSKRPQYILPLMPAVGLFVAATWRRAANRLPGVRAAAVTLAGLGAAFLIGDRAIPDLVPATPAVAAAIPATARALGVVCLAAGIAAWLAARTAPVALLALSLPVAAIPFVSLSLMREIGRDRSAVEIAAAVEAAAAPGTEVIGVRAFPPSLPFYLRRPIVLASADGSELTSNYVSRHYDRLASAAETLQPADWWRSVLLPCRRPRVFVVRADDHESRRILAGRLGLLAETRKYAAYGPCVLADLARADR